MKLKIWNGNISVAVPFALAQKHGLRSNSYVHAFACAHSRAELVRIIRAWNANSGGRMRMGNGQGGSMNSYIRDYWHEGAWGTMMEGVPFEAGLWVQWRPNTKPQRVWPERVRATAFADAKARAANQDRARALFVQRAAGKRA